MTIWTSDALRTARQNGTTDFSSSTCDGIQAHGVNLTGCSFAGSTLIGADLSNADLTGASLVGATLTGANLNDALLLGVTGLTGAMILSAQTNSGTRYDAASLGDPTTWDLSTDGA